MICSINNWLKISLVIFLFSCQNKPEIPKLDLLKYGLPISIKAPLDAKVEASDLSVMQDVTVQSGSDYNIQIYASLATELDPKKIFTKKKTEIENGPFFSKTIKEEAQGLIYEKKLSENNFKYDFIYVKIQGDKEYIFQSGLFGKHTKVQAEAMYESVK